jgi:predicted methyltransferase
LVPSLLQAAHVSSGQRVLDIATGTGIVAEAVAEVVGPTGHSYGRPHPEEALSPDYHVDCLPSAIRSLSTPMESACRHPNI